MQYIDLCLSDRVQTYYTVDDPSIEYTWLMGNQTLLDTDYDLQMIWPDSTMGYTLGVFGTDTIGCRSEVGYINVAAVRAGEERGNVIVNVNAPSAIDEEGFTRAVILALNNSTNRGTTGAGDLRTSAQIL